MKAKAIWVVGSANYDLVFRTERFPRSGETILGGGFSSFPGGKGANQAVAIGRLGGSVHFVGMVGDDGFGRELSQSLRDSGVDTAHLEVHPTQRSGCASVMIDSSGANQIIVTPGANMALSESRVRAALANVGDSPVLLQLEIPLACNLAAASMARHVFLNPAPADQLSDALLQQLYAVTPNEHEAEQLTGIPTSTNAGCRDAASWLLDHGVQRVVITLGHRGCYWRDPDGEGRIDGYRVSAVDTVGAGDAFSGAFVYFWSQGIAWDECLRRANGVAALSVTRHGAQASMPTLQELNCFLEKQG